MTATSLSLTTHTRQELEDIVKSTKCALDNGLSYLELLQNKIAAFSEGAYEWICKLDIENAEYWGMMFQDLFDAFDGDFDYISEFLKDGLGKIHQESQSEKTTSFFNQLDELGITSEEIEKVKAEHFLNS